MKITNCFSPKGYKRYKDINKLYPVVELKDQSAENKLTYSTIMMSETGNCMFECIAYQIIGDSRKHLEVRNKVVQHMVTNKKAYQKMLIYNQELDHEKNFTLYCSKMSHLDVWGTKVEL